MALTKRAFYALFAIIIIEGYIVLSSELLAIRVTIPFIGSGTDMVSIIIAAVLLPLSFGYYFGGQFRPHINKAGRWISVQHKLTNNILWAAAFLLIGISYYPLEVFLTFLINHGVTNRVMLASIYSGLFLIIPVFLLGQTIPLVSNYFSKEKLSEITGHHRRASYGGVEFHPAGRAILLFGQAQAQRALGYHVRNNHVGRWI
jgi:hypothetical protein